MVLHIDFDRIFSVQFSFLFLFILTCSLPTIAGEKFTVGETTYEVVGPLGEGGGGQVFRVKVVGSDPVVEYGMKFFHHNATRIQDINIGYRILNRLTPEQKKHLSRLQMFEPQVVTNEQGEKNAVVVMPLAKGTLADLRDHTELSSETPREEVSERVRKLGIIADQIFKPTSQLRTFGRAHLDIKPKNYFIPVSPEKVFSSEAPIQLSDHDALRGYGDLRTNIGSLGYIAPEIMGSRNLNGTGWDIQPRAAANTDVYSAGNVLYYMVFGKSAQVDFLETEKGKTLLEAHREGHRASTDPRNAREMDEFIVRRFNELISSLKIKERDRRQLVAIRDRVLAAIAASEVTRSTDGKITRKIAGLEQPSLATRIKLICKSLLGQIK